MTRSRTCWTTITSTTPRRRVAAPRDLLYGVAPCYGGGRPFETRCDHRVNTVAPGYVASDQSPEAKNPPWLSDAHAGEHETFGAVLTHCRTGLLTVQNPQGITNPKRQLQTDRDEVARRGPCHQRRPGRRATSGPQSNRPQPTQPTLEWPQRGPRLT